MLTALRDLRFEPPLLPQLLVGTFLLLCGLLAAPDARAQNWGARVHPSSGGPDTQVRIYGDGFSATTGDNVVTFGGVQADVESASQTRIVARVPSFPHGPVPVRVSSPDTSITAANPFTVVSGGTGSYLLADELTGLESGTADWIDANQNGHLDLLVTGVDNNVDTTTTLYLNDGAGGFSAVDPGFTPVANSAVAVGDVNGDVLDDVVLTGNDGNGPIAEIYLNDPAGGFLQADTGIEPVDSSSVTLGDVDSDGDLDLFLTGSNLSSNATATLYINDGTGNFSGSGETFTAVKNSSSTFGDVNDDGHLDVVYTGQTSDLVGEVLVYQNNGDGTFSTGTSIDNLEGGSVSLGDADADGALDLFVTGIDGNDFPRAKLYVNDGTGSFSDSGQSFVGVTNSTSEFGDMTGDGAVDLVVTGLDDTGSPTTSLYVNDGTGSFLAVDAGLGGVEHGATALGDVYGNGALDLFVSGLDTNAAPTLGLYGNEFVSPDISVDDSPLSESLTFGEMNRRSIQIENTATSADASHLDFDTYALGLAVEDRTKDVASTQDVETEPKSHGVHPPRLLDDPVNDTDSEVANVDQVRAGIAGDVMNVVIENAALDSTRYVGSFLLDVDRDSSTGVQPDFLRAEQEIGAEYEVFFDLSVDGEKTAILRDVSGVQLGQAPLDVDSSKIHFSISLAPIHAPLPFHMAGLVGAGSDQPTDWLPDAGNMKLGTTRWLSLSPSFSSLGPGESGTIDVQFDATRVPPGDYEGVIHVRSTDQDQPITEVPVSFSIDSGVTFHPPEDPPAAGSNVPLDINFPDTFSPTAGALLYAPSGARTPERHELEISSGTQTVSTEIPGSAVTEQGTRYAAQLNVPLSDRPTDLQFSVPPYAPDSTAFLPVALGNVEAEGSFPSNAYRMLTIPVDLGDRSGFEALQDQYGSYDPSRWRLARWDPGSSSYQFGDAAAPLEPGQAAWLINEAGDRLTIDDALSADASSPQAIPIQSGWNQVGNPFSFPVSWAEVGRSDAVHAPVGFDSTGYRFDVQTLSPWQGYFVYNDADSTTTLYIPPVEATEEDRGVTLAKAASAESGYRLQAIASAYQDGRRLQDASTWLGFSNGAVEGFGPEDHPKPPPIGSPVQLKVVQDNGPPLAQSLKPNSSEGAVWDLRVEYNDRSLSSSQEVTIQLAEEGPRPDGFQRYVIDRRTNTRLPLTNESVTVQLAENERSRNLRVIVGTESFARTKSEGAPLSIEETKLRTNAPNPFSESTSITYQLADDTEVTITIYDTLGRRVQTLTDERKRTGVHHVEWRPDSRGGRSLASGIYFCRMKTPNYRETRKLVLVR